MPILAVFAAALIGLSSEATRDKSLNRDGVALQGRREVAVAKDYPIVENRSWTDRWSVARDQGG